MFDEILTRQRSQKRARVKEKPSKLRRREMRWGILFITPWIIGFLAFYLIPMVASFGFSLYEFPLANPDEAQFIGLANWNRMLFDDPEVLPAFLRVFRFGLISLPITMGFAFFVAVLLNSELVWGKALYRALFYMPSMIPLVATVLIWNGVFNEHTGWINMFLENILGIPALGVEGIRWTQNPRLIYFTYTGMGLWGIGSAMMIYLAGLQGVPTELYDAAKVDGAGWWRRLRSVTLPLISPVVFYQLILSLIGLLQYFLAPFVLNRGDGSPQGTTRFIMVYFYKQAFTFFNMGYGAALAWVLFFVALLLTVAAFATARHWVYYAGGGES
jgi:multiple sugar transport system permease protein